MCLAIPGKVIQIADGDLRLARVAFGPIEKEVSLVCLPDASVGDYVIVHAGFAIGRLDEDEAVQVFGLLDRLTEPAV
ncbi:MAG: HypC/HybG/HupF family hydrogenase formation chaperone [Myxococcales bacterium]|jgi:hydrogenase expression/formation protein HypC